MQFRTVTKINNYKKDNFIVAGICNLHHFNGFVLFFYVLNLVMVGTDLVLYVRNYRLDKQAEKEAV